MRTTGHLPIFRKKLHFLFLAYFKANIILAIYFLHRTYQKTHRAPQYQHGSPQWHD